MQYVNRMDHLLGAQMSREALSDGDRHCRQCTNGNLAVWRCKDCALDIPMYWGCMRSYYQENLFHRIEH